MADPFLGEIKAFGFEFAPRDWARCDGQMLPLPQNTALFALLGFTYGGDGRMTFRLPDMQGRVALGRGRANETEFPMGESRSFVSADATPVDEASCGTLGVNFCIALQGYFPRRQ